MPRLPPFHLKGHCHTRKEKLRTKKVAGSHYIFANIETKRRVTVPFHSNQEIAKGTLLQILKDAGISKEELQDLLQLL